MKMDQKMIIVSSLVVSLGVLSAILGFSAEGTKLTRSDVLYLYLGVCLYPPNPALWLGVCAAIFLVLAQTTFAVGGGCCGFYKSGSSAIPSATNQTVGVICAVFSWITAVFALGLLVSGVAWNAPGTRDSPAFGLCYVPKEGIFTGGAVLALVAVALALTSYIILRTQPAAAPPMKGEQIPAGAVQIVTAQPHFPPASSPPYKQGPNPHYRPFPAQGYGAHAPNYHQQQQQQFVHPPEQGYGVHPPNHQYTPPAHSYGGHAPDEQFSPASPPPRQGYGPHRPNLEAPPPEGHDHM